MRQAEKPFQMPSRPVPSQPVSIALITTIYLLLGQVSRTMTSWKLTLPMSASELSRRSPPFIYDVYDSGGILGEPSIQNRHPEPTRKFYSYSHKGLRVLRCGTV